jgi:diguanylate cyclase (GGDEF)-like protein
MAETRQGGALEPKGTDWKEIVAILFFGLACGAILIYHVGVKDYDALLLLFVVPVIMLASAKGFRYGALLAVICGMTYGTLVLLRILQGNVGSGFLLHNVANLGLLIGFGFVLGIVSEYFRFGIADQWRQETRIVETFIPDEETGLYNFKSFRWMLRGDVTRLKRYGRPLSVVFFRVGNIDEFRRKYEELEEIKLFRELGTFFRKVVRESDYIGRYSDDEIGLSLPETDDGGCKVLVGRLVGDRDLLTELIGARWNQAALRLQIAAATFPKDAKTMEVLVDVLDSRYRDF